MVVYDEHIRHTPLASFGLVGLFLLMGAAIIGLTRLGQASAAGAEQAQARADAAAR